MPKVAQISFVWIFSFWSDSFDRIRGKAIFANYKTKFHKLIVSTAAWSVYWSEIWFHLTTVLTHLWRESDMQSPPCSMSFFFAHHQTLGKALVLSYDGFTLQSSSLRSQSLWNTPAPPPAPQSTASILPRTRLFYSVNVWGMGSDWTPPTHTHIGQ